MKRQSYKVICFIQIQITGLPPDITHKIQLKKLRCQIAGEECLMMRLVIFFHQTSLTGRVDR